MREKILYDGFLKVKQVEHNGHTFEVISPKDAVMILYTDVKDCVHLVKQFRPAVGQDVIECPAGTIDRDALPEKLPFQS